MRDLQQPDSSHCDRHNSIHGCAFPNIEVRIGLQSTLASRAPDWIPFFQNWDWNFDNQMSSEEWHEDNRYDLSMTGYSDEEIHEATAVWYLKNHDDWKNGFQMKSPRKWQRPLLTSRQFLVNQYVYTDRSNSSIPGNTPATYHRQTSIACGQWEGEGILIYSSALNQKQKPFFQQLGRRV